MAKHRKKHHTKRRVSGIGKDSATMEVVGAVVGYVAGNTVNTKVTTLDPKILAAIELLIPILLAKKLKGSLMKGIGAGIAVAGAKQAGKAFNIAILSGYPVVNGMAVVQGTRRRVGNYVGGSADQPYLRTGAAGNNILSGIPKKKPMSGEEIYAGTMMETKRNDDLNN